MRKIITTLALLLLATMAAACGNNASQPESSFVPFTENLVLVYGIEGPEVTEAFVTFNAFVGDNRLQRFIQLANGNNLVEVIEIIDGRPVVVIGGSGTFSPYSSLIGESSSMFYVILPENIAEGERWRAHPSNETDTTIKEITAVDVIVTTPAGTFTAIEIKTTGHSSNQYLVEPVRFMYFAPGVGLVKQRDYAGIPISVDMADLGRTEQVANVTTLLEIRHTGLEGSTPTFHLDANGEVPTIPIALTTNADLLDVINQMLVDAVYATFGHTLADDARILSYFANPNTENLHIDFSSGIIREMQAFADYDSERIAILALGDMLMFFFDAWAATFTVEGEPFAGQFVTLRSMEFIPRGGSSAYLPQEELFDQETVTQAATILRNLHPNLEAVIGLINDTGFENLHEFENVLHTVFSAWMVEDIFMQTVDVNRILWDANEPLEVVSFEHDSIWVNVGDSHGVIVILADNEWRIDYVIIHE